MKHPTDNMQRTDVDHVEVQRLQTLIAKKSGIPVSEMRLENGVWYCKLEGSTKWVSVPLLLSATGPENI